MKMGMIRIIRFRGIDIGGIIRFYIDLNFIYVKEV